MRYSLSIGFALLVGAATNAGDANRCGPFWRSWPTAWRVCPPMCGCPDDYDCKLEPCIRCLKLRCLPADYCGKPTPCVPVLSHCGQCDDYCWKSTPCLLCPVATPDYKCGPPPCKVTH